MPLRCLFGTYFLYYIYIYIYICKLQRNAFLILVGRVGNTRTFSTVQRTTKEQLPQFFLCRFFLLLPLNSPPHPLVRNKNAEGNCPILAKAHHFPSSSTLSHSPTLSLHEATPFSLICTLSTRMLMAVVY